ncbi:hypothetical protein UUU_15540 [Klebsiella pneumoniae subsp. pneumoniae DSM 30104 = JCM 1662 = NBRC 14940]|nr:hypothetical protein UUU_15540 [Klebsiella pneumoniae subsp. pneumoniae DSM 30104 = JCM 1662 = NBRC 14940]
MITSRTNSRKITLLNHNKPANKSSNCIVVPSPLALKKTLHHHKVVNNHLNSHRIKLFSTMPSRARTDSFYCH